MSNGIKKSMSWGWLIFWLIIIWPVGIFFLFRKLTADKTAILKYSKIIAIVSYIIIFYGIISLIMTFEDTSMLIGVVLFGGGGIWLLRISKKMKRKGQKYKKYIAIVINQSQTSIDYIASSIGESYEIAANDLQEMIDAGYFTNAYINEGSRIIVLSQDTSHSVNHSGNAQAQTKVVACSSCGANNTIIAGQTIECEYCGSPLQ